MKSTKISLQSYDVTKNSLRKKVKSEKLNDRGGGK